MMRQALTAPSRALSSSLRLATSRPFVRSQFHSVPALSQRVLRPAGSRWYSDETAPKDAAEQAKAGAKEGSPTESEVKDGSVGSEAEAALKKQLEAKEKEVLDWKDKYLRSVADFRNLQDRTQRDMKGARDFAIQKFAKDLVDSVDNLDRALTMAPAETVAAEVKTGPLRDLANLHEGLRMTEAVLMQTLQRHGLERFSPAGEKFNPNEHEATFMTPQPDKEDGTVFHVQQTGFKLNGRVLRAAKVGVVKNK